MTLTVTQLIQLYAPLAGLLMVVFWLGVLSQKVKNLQETVDKLERADDADGSSERLVRLEVKMETVADTMGAMKRSMDGVQRQLGNLMIKPPIHEFGAEHG